VSVLVFTGAVLPVLKSCAVLVCETGQGGAQCSAQNVGCTVAINKGGLKRLKELKMGQPHRAAL